MQLNSQLFIGKKKIKKTYPHPEIKNILQISSMMREPQG
jgi:hypothetical protein